MESRSKLKIIVLIIVILLMSCATQFKVYQKYDKFLPTIYHIRTTDIMVYNKGLFNLKTINMRAEFIKDTASNDSVYALTFVIKSKSFDFPTSLSVLNVIKNDKTIVTEYNKIVTSKTYVNNSPFYCLQLISFNVGKDFFTKLNVASFTSIRIYGENIIDFDINNEIKEELLVFYKTIVN